MADWWYVAFHTRSNSKSCAPIRNGVNLTFALCTVITWWSGGIMCVCGDKPLTISAFQKNYFPPLQAKKPAMQKRTPRELFNGTWNFPRLRNLTELATYVTVFQEDLDGLCNWSLQWKLKFKGEKCVLLRCGSNCHCSESSYVLNGHLIAEKQTHWCGCFIRPLIQWPLQLHCT